MDSGLQALFLFYLVSSLIILSVAKFARATAITGKEIAITDYNLKLAKLMVIVLPMIPVWCFTVKWCILT